jgi:hypothetical protein
VSDTTAQSEGWQRDVAKRNEALQDVSRKLVDERRQHAELRDELAALAVVWRGRALDPAGPLSSGAAGAVLACADQLTKALARGGQG